VAAGDFNGDGRPDVAVANSGSNNDATALGETDTAAGGRTSHTAAG
jgi:hypothetical protein